MTIPPGPKQPPLLDYQKKAPSAESGGCLTLSILFTIPIMFCLVITLAMFGSDSSRLGVLIFIPFGLGGLVFLGVIAKKKLGINPHLQLY